MFQIDRDQLQFGSTTSDKVQCRCSSLSCGKKQWLFHSLKYCEVVVFLLWVWKCVLCSPFCDSWVRFLQYNIFETVLVNHLLTTVATKCRSIIYVRGIAGQFCAWGNCNTWGSASCCHVDCSCPVRCHCDGGCFCTLLLPQDAVLVMPSHLC